MSSSHQIRSLDSAECAVPYHALPCQLFPRRPHGVRCAPSNAPILGTQGCTSVPRQWSRVAAPGGGLERGRSTVHRRGHSRLGKITGICLPYPFVVSVSAAPGMPHPHQRRRRLGPGPGPRSVLSRTRAHRVSAVPWKQQRGSGRSRARGTGGPSESGLGQGRLGARFAGSRTQAKASLRLSVGRPSAAMCGLAAGGGGWPPGDSVGRQ